MRTASEQLRPVYGTQFGSGGYTEVHYSPRAMRAHAAALAAYLPELMRDTGAEAIAVQGKSGIAMAFAVSMLIDIPIIVVRKPSEGSHGREVEGPNINIRRYLILDDLVATGSTVRRVVDRLSEYSAYNLECAGVVVYLPHLNETHTVYVGRNAIQVYQLPMKGRK